jgi:hypothetical protein
MPHGDVIEIASALVTSVKAGRAGRARVIESARAARRDSRILRSRTRDTFEANLRQGWRLWSAGVVPQPPGLVPQAWVESTASSDLVSYALDACAEAYDRAHSFCNSSAASEKRVLERTFALIAAATAVAHARLTEDLDLEALDALSVCIRVIDKQESALAGKLESPEAVMAASAARRCVTASRRTLASQYGARV